MRKEKKNYFTTKKKYSTIRTMICLSRSILRRKALCKRKKNVLPNKQWFSVFLNQQGTS